LIAEDLLVLLPDETNTQVLIDGEDFVRSWSRRVSKRLAPHSAAAVPTGDLLGVLAGKREPLDKILFVSSERRVGTSIAAERLDDASGLIALMTNNFLGAIEPTGWRRYFEAAKRLSTAQQLFEARVPAGLIYLAPAAEHYMSSWTS
jgi:hypothetical protein